MAVPRQAFNAGEFGPKLWWRSDISKYTAACRYLENFLVTPQGAAWRCPGFEAVARVPSFGFGSTPCRIINFDVSQSLSYIIAMVPNATGATSNFLVYSTAGGLLATIAAPYAPSEFDEIYVNQSYDVLFLAHPSHALRRLERSSNTSWALEEHVFNGGPIDTPNADEGHIVKMNTNQWGVAVPYVIGDYVQKGVAYALQGNSANVFVYSTFTGITQSYNFYWTQVQTNPVGDAGNFSPGDRVTIATGDLAGDWEVQAADAVTGFIDLQCGTLEYTGIGATGAITNDYSGIAMGAVTINLQGNKPQLYVCLQDHTGQDPAAAPTYWAERDTLHGTVSIEGNQDSFEADDVGRLLRMQYKSNVSASEEWAAAAVPGSATAVLPAYGSVTMRTEGGVWEGEVALQQSLDGGSTWEDIGVIESVNGASNGSVTREIEQFGILVRGFLRARSDSAAGTGPTDTGCNCYLEVSGIQYAYLQIISVESTTEATAELLNFVPDYILTWKWAWGVFGNENGFPGVVTIQDERLMVMGIPGSPGTIYGSQVNNWEDWQSGTLATSPIQYSLPTGLRNNIRWAVSRQELVIGSDAGEYTLGSRNQDEIMSGTNVRAKQQSQNGSQQVQAIATADLIVFVENGGRRLRSASYSFEDDGYKAIDVSILADHLTEDYQFTQLAYSRAPLPVIWCLRSDGVLCCFVYEQVNEVNGWSRRTFSDAGTIQSICTTQGATGDTLWALVWREDGVYLESMQKDNPCLDWHKCITGAGDDTLYPLLGVESGLIAYNNDWTQVTTPKIGTGIIIRKIAAIADLVIKYDGVQLVEGVEYVVLAEGGLVWLWTETNTSKVTVYDFTTLQTEGVDWEQNAVTESIMLELINDDIILSTMTFEINAVASVLDTDHFVFDNRMVLFPGAASTTITGVDDATAMVSGVDYIEHDGLRSLFCANGIDDAGIVRIGLQENSLLAPTDLTGLLDMGGPGGTTRITEVEVYVVNSLGGEVSGDDGTSWENITDLTPTVVMGEPLPTFTGKKEVRMTHGTQKDGALIRIRNNSPHQMTVACVAIDVRRSE